VGHFNALQSRLCHKGTSGRRDLYEGACKVVSVVVNYNTKEAHSRNEVVAMRKSDRVCATVLAVIVWLIAGHVFASRPVALQAITPPALDARPSTVETRTGHPSKVTGLGVLLQ
jgi:hypothetical protein